MVTIQCLGWGERKRLWGEVKKIWAFVLKKVSQDLKDNRGKWAPNYEGPSIVKKAFSGGALVLANMDDKEFPSPVNADIVKQYYA